MVICHFDSSQIGDRNEGCRELSDVDISDGCSTAGEMVEVGSREGDVGSLRRDLNEIGVRVKEVTELTILNEERLGSSQA